MTALPPGRPDWDPQGTEYRRLRRSRSRVMLVAAAAIIVVFAARAHSASRPPSLLANCHRSQLVLSTAHARPGARVDWAATGPAADRVLLTIDVARLQRAAGGGYFPFAPKGVTDPSLASTAQSLADCHLTGSFSAPTKAGPHTVSMFDVRGAQAPRLASARLTVGG